MSDPFVFASKPKQDTNPDEKPRVMIPCKRCDVPLSRQDSFPYALVHASDETVVKVGATVSVKSTTYFDHDPDPDVIDVEVIS